MIADVGDVDDVRMSDDGPRAALREGTARRRLVFEELPAEDLDGDALLERLVVRGVDVAHSARADPTMDLVVAD